MSPMTHGNNFYLSTATAAVQPGLVIQEPIDHPDAGEEAAGNFVILFAKFWFAKSTRQRNVFVLI